MNYIEIDCCKDKKFRIKATGLIHKAKTAYQDIAIYDTEEFGRCLLLDNVIQCSEKDHEPYDRALLKRLRPDDRRLLILGGGDGYTAEMALKLNPSLEITVVDLDASVVDACRQHLGQKVFEDPRLKLVTADAFHFMKQTGNGKYDGVVCDLTDFPVGYNDGKFREFYASVFPLSKNVLKDGGWIGVYAGSRDAVFNGGKPIAVALEEMLSGLFAGTERQEALIPGYGEPICFLYGKRESDKNNCLQVEVLKKATDVIVNQIIELGRATYPVSSNGDDISEYYADLNNPEYINIVLKRRNEIIGYLLAVPQYDACGYLKDIDPLMIECNDTYYVDAIQIIPGVSNTIGFKLLLKKLIEEAGDRGINKFSMHTRKSNGLSRIILKLFPSTRIFRTIHSFEGTEEPFDYIEGEYTANARITLEK